MDFDLSADQIALREAAATLLDRPLWRERMRARVGDGTIVGTLPGSGDESQNIAPGAPGAPADTHAPGYDEELWAAMADQGWPGVELPEDRGGLGLGMVEVAVLCEEIGRRLAPAPFLSTVLVIDALVHAKPDNETDAAHVAEWIDELVAGTAIGCVAWQPTPELGHTANHTANPPTQGPHALLSGRYQPVLFGPSSDIAVIVAPDSLHALRLDPDGRPYAEQAMDRTRELGWLVLDDTPAIRIGDTAASTRVLDRAAIGTSAEMLGNADRVLAMSVEYAKDRVQFGRPIGSFQAIKHRLADAVVDVEGMRSTVYYAAWCASVDDSETTLAASMAKAWGSDASRRVAASGLQVHGGIGFTWEHDMHLHLKRAQLDQVSYGDAAWHRDRIADILKARVESGQGVF